VDPTPTTTGCRTGYQPAPYGAASKRNTSANQSITSGLKILLFLYEEIKKGQVYFLCHVHLTSLPSMLCSKDRHK